MGVVFVCWTRLYSFVSPQRKNDHFICLLQVVMAKLDKIVQGMSCFGHIHSRGAGRVLLADCRTFVEDFVLQEGAIVKVCMSVVLKIRYQEFLLAYILVSVIALVSQVKIFL